MKPGRRVMPAEKNLTEPCRLNGGGGDVNPSRLFRQGGRLVTGPSPVARAPEKRDKVIKYVITVCYDTIRMGNRSMYEGFASWF